MTQPNLPDPAQILASIGQVAYAWTAATDAMTWSPNVRDVLKLEADRDLSSGRAFSQILAPGGRQMRFETLMRSPLRDTGSGVPYSLEYPLQAQTGAPPLWIEDSGRWFAGPDGLPARAHGVLRVVNERHEEAERLAYLSRYDALTGEMNRVHLTEELAAAIEDSMRLRSSCGFLIVSIDNLAGLNDAYGYEVTDELIGAVARRIRSRLRGQDHLGRYSGNKFGIILRDCSPDDMVIAAERLLASMRDEVVSTQAGPVAVTLTIGGTTAPRHARNVREMLARAHDALDSAKARRRGSFQEYRPNAEREARRLANFRTTDEIVAALNDRRVSLVFEGVVAAATRQPAFYECLMRVQRSDGAVLPAQDVIPAAERLGLVRLLDLRVLELVVQELLAHPNLRASVNVSAPSTTDPGWWSGLVTLLRKREGVGQRLTVEITETAAIQDIDETRGFVARVKDLGCRIAIDDFGAGYTSFRNLRRLGVDIVKIDGAFVANMGQSEDDAAFVRTLIDLAQRLHIETVAEWVQNEQSAAMLTAWGCNYLQGALVGLASAERPWCLPDSPRAAVG